MEVRIAVRPRRTAHHLLQPDLVVRSDGGVRNRDGTLFMRLKDDIQLFRRMPLPASFGVDAHHQQDRAVTEIFHLRPQFGVTGEIDVLRSDRSDRRGGELSDDPGAALRTAVDRFNAGFAVRQFPDGTLPIDRHDPELRIAPDPFRLRGGKCRNRQKKQREHFPHEITSFFLFSLIVYLISPRLSIH